MTTALPLGARVRGIDTVGAAYDRGMRRVQLLLSLAAGAAFGVLAAGCGGGGGGAGCNSARGTLPDGLTTLSWDNGTAAASVRGQGFQISVGNQTFDLDTEPMYEAVRFDLERPATIYGFQVVWNHLGAVSGKSDAPLAAGLYPDFGYNGFDFWRADPYWTGSRCAGDLAADGSVEYVLREPLRIDQPGLVYVAHDAPTGDDPTFAFDDDYVNDPAGQCAAFTDCHSALDLDQALTNQFYDGLSLSFPYDYLVRLYVKYDDPVPDADVLFHKSAAMPAPGVRAAWGDYDNDGYDDLLTTQSPGDAYDANDLARLYHNDGTGTFVDVSTSAGIAAFHGSGSWGDYDDDGCLDAYLTSWSPSFPNTLLHGNCDGTFTDVTTIASAGADLSGTLVPLPCPDPNEGPYVDSQAAAWVDLDGDGFLDLYVANYNCGFNLPEYTDFVYRNRGDGTFDDWTSTHGFLDPPGMAGRGANPLDVDMDGAMDVLVHDYVLERNLFFHNLGNGTGSVREEAKQDGLDGNVTYFASQPYYGHTLGTAWGDLDGDGDWDLVEANLAHPRFYGFSNKTRVLLQDAATHTWSDISGDWSFPASAAGLRYQETHTSPTLADFDDDGNLDLFISSRYDGRPTDFYRGNGDGTFRLDMTHSGVDSKNGWCVSATDVDHDGDLDVSTIDGLYLNTMTLGTNHWLQVRPVGGVASNRAAIGAIVKVHAGTKTWMRYVEGSTGQGCQDSMALHFGLGNVSSVDSIDVLFPGGGTKSYPGPFAADQRLWLYENGTVTPGWNAPW